jgi:hypothetical protein
VEAGALLAWRGKEEELFAHDNPFALFVLAHLLIVPTEGDQEARAEWKLRLWKRTCEHKMEAQDRGTLLRRIDGMLLLPQQLNRVVVQQFLSCIAVWIALPANSLCRSRTSECGFGVFAAKTTLRKELPVS